MNTKYSDVILLLTKVIDEACINVPEYERILLSEWQNEEIPLQEALKGFLTGEELTSTASDKYLRAVCQLIGATKPSNAIVYYPETCMPWHTNSDAPGLRTYFTFSKGKSYFMSEVNGVRSIKVDEPGWHVNQFEIPTNEKYWHTIYATDFRYSFGFIHA